MKKVYKGTARFQVKTQKIKEFKEEVLKIIGPTREEKNNISYEAFQVLDDSGKPTQFFEFHELWVDKDSMMVEHKDNTPHMKYFFSIIKLGEKDSWVEKVEITGSDVDVL